MGLEAFTLQRADLVQEQLEKLSRAKNPAKCPIPLMDVHTPLSTDTSGALTFQTPASHGKRGHSSDGQRIENKCHKQIQEESQADRQIDPHGIDPNQAEDSSLNNENIFKVPDETSLQYGSTDM